VQLIEDVNVKLSVINIDQFLSVMGTVVVLSSIFICFSYCLTPSSIILLVQNQMKIHPGDSAVSRELFLHWFALLNVNFQCPMFHATPWA
jgi:hypothetical protein